MKQIKNIEKITSDYSAWKPSDIAFIKTIEWSINNLTIIFYSQIRNTASGWPDILKEFFEISIEFQYVQNLKLNFNGLGNHQVSGFDILDVSGNDWEKINFQIEDYEEGSIDFSCADVVVNSVSKPFIITLG